MPLVPLDDAARETALESGSAELRFLFNKEEVPDAVQALFFSIGIKTIARFASVAQDIEDLKTLLKDEFGLDAKADVSSRVIVASLVCAYRTSATGTLKIAEYEGELESKRLPKPLSCGDHVHGGRMGAQVVEAGGERHPSEDIPREEA